jgi:hypothetical protein
MKERFDFSYQTANNIMRVYRYCLERPELVQSMKSSLLYKISAPGFPKDLREYLFENADGLEKISNERVMDLCKRFKNKKLSLDSPEIKALIKFRQTTTLYRSYYEEVKKAMTMTENLAKTISKMSAAIKWPIYPGLEKTKLTSEQAQKLTGLYKEMGEQVKGLKPNYAIFRRKKPRLVTSKK